MAPFFRSIAKTRRPLSPNHHYQTNRTLVDISTIKWVRDRGLDHAVEKENNLKPIINIKNFIKSEPSKSIPITILADNRETLQIPIRPIDFIRKYPSIFEQFLPGGIGVHPHIRLTPEVLNLDAEEQLMYQGQSYRKQAADRLLKLLMLCRVNKIPLCVVDRLKWDLGLPQDYVQTLLPEFPDYFQIIDSENRESGSNDNKGVLELVCWSNELAISVMEKKAMKGETGYRKGMPIAFPLQYSRGFEMDTNFKKSVDEWQKLPYISPYENAFHLTPVSDESDKWAVSVLHELLHILVPKKTEKENILCIGEYLGLRSRFKRALLHHPGIFYVSSKIGTHTVVLRDGYKRDLLIEKHVLMGMRSQYNHLMNTVKESPKPKTALSVGTKKQKGTQDSKGKGEEDGESKEEYEVEFRNSSDSEVEDTSNDEYDDDDEEEEDSENESQIGTRKNYAVKRGRKTVKTTLRVKGASRINVKENPVERHTAKTEDKVLSKFSERSEMNDGQRVHGKLSERSNSPRSGRRDKVPSKFSERRELNNGQSVHGKLSERSNSPRSGRRDKVPSKFSERRELNNGQSVNGRLSERSNSSRSRGRSLPDKRRSAS